MTGYLQIMVSHDFSGIMVYTRYPEPLASDPPHHLALFNYIDGKKLVSSEITGQHIDQVLDFYFAINSCRASEDARLLPKASEACFSLAEHIRLTENRVRNLKNVKGRTETDKKAGQFIRDELLPTWEQVKYAACLKAEEGGLVLDEEIPDGDMRLSPSDFGFHNALEDKDQDINFYGFRISPAGMIRQKWSVIFSVSPEIPIPRRFYSYITEKIVKDLGNPDMQGRRIGDIIARI